MCRLLWLLATVSFTNSSPVDGRKWLFPGVFADLNLTHINIEVNPVGQHYEVEDVQLGCSNLETGETLVKRNFGTFGDTGPTILTMKSTADQLYLCKVVLRDADNINASLVEETLLLTPPKNLSGEEIVRLTIVNPTGQSPIQIGLETVRNFTRQLKIKADVKVWLSGSFIQQYKVDLSPQPTNLTTSIHSALIVVPENHSVNIFNWFRKDPQRTTLEICCSLEVADTDRLSEVCHSVQSAQLGLFHSD